MDSISLLNGGGTFSADIQVVVEADNPVDAPEFLVMTGNVSGSMQVADAKGRLIALSGTYTPETVLGQPAAAFAGFSPASFTGMVRLPFVLDDTISHRRPHRGERALYLGDDGKFIRVEQKEISLGQANARFELNFPTPPGN
jgi:hypothetical protein